MTLRPTSPSKLTAAQRAERATALHAHRTRTAGSDAAITAPTQCSFIPGYDNTGLYLPDPDRLTSCADTYWTVTSTTTDADGVSTTSYFYFEDLQWALFSATSSSWTHGAEVIGYAEGASGDLADGFSALLYSACTNYGAGFCTATPSDPQDVTITPGSDSFFQWTETDDGPSSSTANSDTILDFNLGLDWIITSLNPPAEGLDVEGSSSGVEEGLSGRCDTIATTTDGCVDEEYIPTLSLPLAQYGASAALIQWAQNNMNGAWGLQSNGLPLYRLANSSDRKTNRATICNSTFINQGTDIGGDYGDSDSCDEFPFAGTYESGALNGVDSGAQCAQLTAVEGNPGASTEASAWNKVSVVGSYSADDACVRGHIPLSQNKAAGGAYGGFITSQRLIDADPFWISVS